MWDNKKPLQNAVLAPRTGTWCPGAWAWPWPPQATSFNCSDSVVAEKFLVNLVAEAPGQASGAARRLNIGTAPLLIVGEQTELHQRIHLGCCKVPALLSIRGPGTHGGPRQAGTRTADTLRCAAVEG